MNYNLTAAEFSQAFPFEQTYPSCNTPKSVFTMTPVLKNVSYLENVYAAIEKLKEFESIRAAEAEIVKNRAEIDMAEYSARISDSYYVWSGVDNSVKAMFDSIEYQQTLFDKGCVRFFLPFLVRNYVPELSKGISYSETLSSIHDKDIPVSVVMTQIKCLPSASSLFRSFIALKDILCDLFPYMSFSNKDDLKSFKRYVNILKSGDYNSIVDALIPEILVGIETNPGPFWVWLWVPPLVGILTFRVVDYFVLSRPPLRSVLSYEEDEGFCDTLDNDEEFHNLHMYIAFNEQRRINLGDDLSFFQVRENNQGFLVGIETNPGPSVLSTARSLNSGFFAQMQIPFSVGLDAKSVDLMGDIAEKLDHLMSSGLNVKHDVSPAALANTIDPLIKKLGSYDVKSKAYKMVFTILLCLIAAYVSYKLGKAISKLFISTVCSARNMEESAKVALPFCEYSPQIGTSSIVTGLLSFLYYQVINRSIHEKDLSIFMSGCEKLGKQKEGLGSFVDFVLSILQKFSTFITRSFNIPNIVFTSTGDANIDEMQKALNDLLDTLRSTGLYNAENGKIAMDLESRLRKLKAGIPRSREFTAQHRSIYDLELALKPILSRFERNNIVGNGPRVEPLAAMLGGPSGVGKSTATVPILLAVMAKVLPKERLGAFVENHNDFIWNFVPENHFHDAFHGQFCTIIDEAGFVRDSVGAPDAGAMGAIRFINTACFPLTMAHLEDKGNTNFNSELVFATTNRNYFKWDSMYSSEAYVRRFRISMLAIPKEKYCLEETLCDDPWKRRLDLDKISPDDVFNEDVPEYIPWNFLTGSRAKGPVLDFNGLVDKMVLAYRANKAKGDALLGAHKALKSRYVKERLDAHNELKNKFVEERLAAQMGEEEEVEEESFNFDLFENIDFLDFSFSNPLKVLSLCVVAASGLWYLFRDSIGDQSGDVKGKRTQKKNLKKNFRARPMGAKSLKAQHGANANVVAGSRKVIKRSVYKIFSSENPNACVYATFVKGRACIAPAHFFHTIQSFIDDKLCSENPIIKFERCSTPLISFEVKFEDLSVYDLREEGDPENDLFVCIVPKVVPSHPDITEYFKPLNDDINRSRFEAMLAKPDGKDILFMCTQAYPSGSVTYHPFEVGKSFKYDLPTRTGDCGALLFSVGPTAGRAVIVGMHIAGNGKNIGISTKLDYEMIKSISLLCEAPTVYLEDADDVEIQMGDNFLVGEEVTPLPLPSRNSVIKSKLFGKFNEPKCAPSMLREMDLGDGPKDPWQFARSKYSRPQKAIDFNLLEVVACGVSQGILYSKKFDDPWDARLYSFEEAVQGIPGVNFAEGIPRNTSAGYPFSLDIKLKGKKDWFGSDGDYDFTSEKCLKLKASVFKSIEDLEKGFRMRVVYADYLKDERRPIEKVVAGKTRLISASPLDYLIICRMYFGDFVRSAMSGRINNGMAIGMNPYSSEWSYLVEHLQSVGDNCIFGDYSAYDGSLPVAFMYKALDIIEDFYASAKCNPQDSVVRAALFEDIVNSRHLCVKDGKGFIYEWNGSNPSGNFLTTLLNSICDLMLIRYAACKIAVESKKYSGYLSASTDFSHHVRCIVFGDDNGISVSNEWATFLDQISFTREMKEIGMTYTDESKLSTNDFTHRSITECSFLKRAFKYDPKSRRWDAPLEKSTIEEMCNWTKRSSSDKDLFSTVDMALKEAAFHGEDYYNDFASRLRNATLEEMDYVPVVNFKSALVEVRSSDLTY